MRQLLRRNAVSAFIDSSNANMAAGCLQKQLHAAIAPLSEVMRQRCVGSVSQAQPAFAFDRPVKSTCVLRTILRSGRVFAGWRPIFTVRIGIAQAEGAALSCVKEWIQFARICTRRSPASRPKRTDLPLRNLVRISGYRCFQGAVHLLGLSKRCCMRCLHDCVPIPACVLHGLFARWMPHRQSILFTTNSEQSA